MIANTLIKEFHATLYINIPGSKLPEYTNCNELEWCTYYDSQPFGVL